MTKTMRLLVWALLFITGLVLWLIDAVSIPQRAWIAALGGFLFIVPMSCGLFTWSAIVKASYGEWPAGLERIPLAALGCAVPSLAALVALWIWKSYWEPWSKIEYPQGSWYSPIFVLTRDFVVLFVFWSIAWGYYRNRRKGPARHWASWLLIIYAITLSLISFDQIMGLVPGWESTAFGMYFFITAAYAGIALWGILACGSRISKIPERGEERISQFESQGRLHDIGKLIYTFAIISTYLLFCQLLPIWYENMPDETSFLIPRMNFEPWHMVSIALLIVIFLGPVVYLLPSRVKRTPWMLSLSCIVILTGLWIERLWLILPGYRINSLSLSDIGALLLLFSACAAGMEYMYNRIPEILPNRNI